MGMSFGSTLYFDTNRLKSTYVVLMSCLMAYAYQSIWSVFDVGALSRQSLKLERNTGLGICYLAVIAMFLVYNFLLKSPATLTSMDGLTSEAFVASVSVDCSCVLMLFASQLKDSWVALMGQSGIISTSCTHLIRKQALLVLLLLEQIT
jgi:hypothetical protein